MVNKTLTLIIIASVVFIACHKKAVPTFSTRSIDITETAKSKENTNPDPEAGKITFMSHCNRCHDLPDPSKYTAKQFETILPIMTRRARLTKEETDNVTVYLKEHSAN